jgi:two-component system, LytTR family, response regulator
MITAIIIDDERNSRDSLRKLIERYCPQVQVIAEADGCQSGIEVIRNHNPDVVFLDVQMSDGSGFNLLEALGIVYFEVIFITAYDQYAIQAIRFSALDYLLKPVIPEELENAVQTLTRVKERRMVNKKIDVLLDSIKHPEKHPGKLVLHTADKIHVVDTTSIVHCESDDYYTRLYLNDGKQIMISKTLKEVEEMLKDFPFIRTHKSHLVNTAYIRSFDKDSGGALILEGGIRIPVARRKRDTIFGLLHGL